MKFEEFKRELKGISELAEGWRGKVYCALWKGEKVSVKVAKDKSVVKAIQKEAEILEELRGMEGFPQILFKGEDFFVYRFIEGTPFRKAKLSTEEERKVLRELLRIAYTLDSMGINRDEFSNIDKNVLIGNEGKVFVLDFERGKFSKRPTNVTQLIQLLLKKGYLELEEAVLFGKRYSKDREGVFRELSERLK